MADERAKFLRASGEPIDVEGPPGHLVARKRSDRDAIAALGLESHASRIGRGMQDLIAQPVVRRARYADGDRDAWSGSAVRLGKEMATNGGAEPLRDVTRRRGRGAKQRHELVPARMRDQLSFPKVGPRQVEDRAKHTFRV